MMSLYVIFICVCLPGILSRYSVKEAQQIIKRSAYEFAIDLTARIAVDKENHFIASTLSLWSILASASLGADGATVTERKKVLKLHDHKCSNQRDSEVIQAVTANDACVTMKRSSNIFVDEKLGLTCCLQKKIERAGIINIVTLSFDNPEITAACINDYVARATSNSIIDIVVPSDLDGVNLVMVDATYFKGLWQIPFPYENTQVKPFYNHLGAQTGYVNMMSLSGTFNMSYISQINAQVLELPYGEDGRFSMLVFLPDQGGSLSVLIDSLKHINLTTVYNTFERDSMKSVSVELPRFKIASELHNLKDLLIDMGLRSAFDSGQAELPLISPFDLYISNFVQKANIEVTEEGCTVCAATEAGLSRRSSGNIITFNRPFLMIITTEPAFITGVYSNPSLY